VCEECFKVPGELLLRQLEIPERSRRNELGTRGKAPISFARSMQR
jgi:hypothetical protein